MADNGPPRSPRSVSFPFRTELPPASLPSPPSLSDLPAGGAQPTETTSTVIVDAPLVSADPIPDPSPPATVADDPRDKYEFFTTPLKENPKPYAYDPVIDKQRGPVLVNKSGMGPRFRELPVDEFLKAIHKASPTDEQRKKFEGVDLSGVDVSKFKEKDWYPLLTKTANSVFDAYNDTKHVYLNTATHKAEEPAGTDGKKRASHTATFNDAGVYWTNPSAAKATKLTKQQNKRTKMTEEELKACGKVGARSWDWVAIPVEIKHDLKKTAFYFHDAAKKKPTKSSKRTKSSKTTKASKSTMKSTPACASSAPATPLGDAEGPTHPPTVPGVLSQPVSSLQDGDPPTAGGTKEGTAKFVRNSKAGEEALAQFAEYMLNVLNHQHRIFCYAVYVWQHMARLFCFDRGAVILSTEFSWLNVDSPLHDFLGKVAQMKRVELGCDPTAKLVNDTVADPFKKMAHNLDVPEPIRDYVRAATADGIPIYKISITPMAAPPDEELPADPSSQPDQSSVPSPPPKSSPSPTPCVEPETRYFLVGRPHFVTDSLFGRCTRGYVAYELDTKRLCFIKDYWRPYVSGRSRPEHLLLERLNSLKVQNVATLMCGGDVDGLRAQKTEFQGMLDHLKASPVPRVHYRMATEEIGLPLEEFVDFNELVLVFFDAVRAHYDAWTMAHVLHRDISVGNILIDPVTRRGILIDWDLYRFEWELALGPTEPERTGTWEFRSALSLKYPRKPPRLSDDLESFIHAFRYLVLKYHITTTHSLRTLINSTFEDSARVCGIMVGGEAKLRQMRSSAPPFQVAHNDNLQALLDEIHQECYQSYQRLDLDKLEKLYGIVDPKLDDSSSRKLKPSPRPKLDLVNIPFPGASTSTVSEADHGEQPHKHGGEAPAPGAADSTETRDSKASEPCAMTGIFSHHGYLSKVLGQWYQKTTFQEEKARNQFVFRGQVLRQDVQQPVPRFSLRGISAMSVSSSDADIVPANLYSSIGSSEGSFLSVGGSYIGKRALEELDEDEGDGSESFISSNGDSSMHGQEDDHEVRREANHTKRRKLRL